MTSFALARHEGAPRHPGQRPARPGRDAGGRGGEVTRDDEFPGHARFYAADPLGNRSEFLEPRS